LDGEIPGLLVEIETTILVVEIETTILVHVQNMFNHPRLDTSAAKLKFHFTTGFTSNKQITTRFEI
jgi:hypothetical protein